MENKKDIVDILPSLEDAEMFYESRKQLPAILFEELKKAIDEKYNNKVMTKLSFEVTDKNKFRCTLSISFQFLSNHWFHFVSFEKSLYDNFPVKLFAYGNKKPYGIAKDINEMQCVLKTILINKRCEMLLLGNLRYVY